MAIMVEIRREYHVMRRDTTSEGGKLWMRHEYISPASTGEQRIEAARRAMYTYGAMNVRVECTVTYVEIGPSA